MTDIKVETIQETLARCERHGATWLGDRVEFAVHDIDLPRKTVEAVFDGHGLGSLVKQPPKPESALKMASRRGRNPNGYMVREFVSPNPDVPTAIHVTEVTGDDESGDEYTCLARVRIGLLGLDEDGNTFIQARAFPPEGVAEFPNEEARERAEWIADYANHLLTHVDSSQMGKALRAGVEKAGGIKSRGGGNNYYVIRHHASAVHAFLNECAEKLGIYYLRDPKTSLGATHDQAVMQDAGKRKLTEELALVREKLEKEIELAKNPPLTDKGNPVSREALIKRQMANVQDLGARFSLYKEVVEETVLGPMRETQELYQRHLRALLQGSVIEFLDEDLPAPSAPPASEETAHSATTATALPAPVSEQPAEPVGADDEGIDLDDLFEWTETA